MPHVKCCVRECAATTRRNPNLCFYALPVPKDEKETWMRLIQNDDIDDSLARWTKGVCSLHFVGGRRSHMNVVPTIFPWSPEWPAIIEDYNSKLINEIGLQDDQGSLKKRNKAPFPLPIPVPVQVAERVDGGGHSKLPPVLYFRSQHADQWTRFHQKTPVLSCLGGHTEIQKAQEPSISPSSPSSCTSQKTDDTPDETLPSVKKEDSDGSSTDDNDETGVEDDDPMSLLLTGKAHRLMEVLQVYRKNTIPTASEEQQECSDSGEWKPNLGMGEELLSKPNCVSTADKNWAADNHNTFSGEGERSLPLQNHQTITIEGVTYTSLPVQDYRTITVEGVTYTSVFKSSEEDILAKYIIKTSSRLNLRDICRKVYKFCMNCGIKTPPEWQKKHAADVGWVTGFFRRHPNICRYYETQDVAKTHHSYNYTYYDRYTPEGVRMPVLLVNHNKKKVNHTSTVIDEHNYSVKLI